MFAEGKSSFASDRDLQGGRTTAFVDEFDLFWRASDRDAVYNKVGGVLRAGTSTASYVGAETDVYAAYNVTRHLLSYAGYSHVFTGEFINKTGPHKDSDFYFAALQYTF